MNKIVGVPSSNSEPLDDFTLKVYAYCTHIPRGKVTTYKLLAAAAGKPKCSRQVGKVLSENPFAPIVPCHRVIMSNGKLGGFFGSTENKSKAMLLQAEGVNFTGNGLTKSELQKFVFSGFTSITIPITEQALTEYVKSYSQPIEKKTN